MAANIGQYRALQIFVLEEDRAPGMAGLYAGQICPQGVGIVEAGGFIDIERRIRIGPALFIGWQRKHALPDPHLGGNRRAERGKHPRQQHGKTRTSLHKSPFPLAVCGTGRRE